MTYIPKFEHFKLFSYLELSLRLSNIEYMLKGLYNTLLTGLLYVLSSELIRFCREFFVYCRSIYEKAESI